MSIWAAMLLYKLGFSITHDCRKCGWSDYELVTIKTDDEGNELPEEEWVRGCPHCRTDKYISLKE